MEWSNGVIRHRVGLAIGALSAAIAVSVAGVAGVRSAGRTPRPDPVGSGAGGPERSARCDFVPRVHNPYFPLKPGSKWRYKGNKEGTRMTDVVRVTHRTKTILGVKATVVHDVVRMHGRPQEVTNDYYAQDRNRNVWYFGEATKELDGHGNTISTEGSFKAGVDGARAGVCTSRASEGGGTPLVRSSTRAMLRTTSRFSTRGRTSRSPSCPPTRRCEPRSGRRSSQRPSTTSTTSAVSAPSARWR